MNKEYKNIILTDEGLKAINAPEKPYQEVLQQAIKEGVTFKDRLITLHILVNAKDSPFESQDDIKLNKPYDIPDGYEVRVEQRYSVHGDKHSNSDKPELIEYAILVPKEKVDFSKFEGRSLFVPKQQSIEEAMSNKQKTAMQEFLRFMGIDESDPHIKPFLEKERQQIIKAVDVVRSYHIKENIDGEQYFNETYGSHDKE